MQRRHLLATLSVASLSTTTGCAGVLGTACEPGDSALGTLYDSVHQMINPGDVSVRGTITWVSSLDVVISDGTGYGCVRAPSQAEFNRHSEVHRLTFNLIAPVETEDGFTAESIRPILGYRG